MPKMTNPFNEMQFERLRKAIDWSLQRLEFPKRKRIENIKQYIGYHYADKGPARRVPVNFLKMAVIIHVRLLAPRAPRALISTKQMAFKPTAKDLELAVNQIPAEIDLQNTMRDAVTEALFSMAVVKHGLHTVGEALNHDYGAPFVDLVTLDDFIIDMATKRIDQIQYIGDEYWLDYDDLMNSGEFPKRKLNGLEHDVYTIQGEAGEERAEGITKPSDPELFKDKIKLRDIWLPTEKLMVTYAVKAKKLLKVMEWEGPERGPYTILGFDPVPNNTLPLAPASTWRDLHESANRCYRKLSEQADAQKSVQAFSNADSECIESFKKARDGDGIAYTGQPPNTLSISGPDNVLLAFFLQQKQLFSYFANGLDLLGGLSPMSETLGQDKLLSQSSTAQLRDMSSQVISFAREIFRALAYYEWYDPVRTRLLEKPIPNTDMNLVVPWDRDSKQGKFSIYDLEIDPYSLQDDSPGSKLQRLGAMLQQYIMPMEPSINAAGGIIDVQTIVSLLAKYADLPEIKDIVKFAEQPPQLDGQQGGMPSQTTRRYERVNRPGATPQGSEQALTQALLGGRPQDAEMASIGRQAS